MTHARDTHTSAAATANRSSRTRRISVALAALAVAALPLTTGVGSAAAASSSTSTTAEVRAAVVKLTNEARAAKGCTVALKVSGRITTAAQGHASDMAAQNYFSHTSKDGRTWDTRIRNAGWKKPAGENIAYGFEAANSVMKGWMNSPGHKRNILNCKFNYIGIGYSADGQYWVQNFGY